MARDSGIIGTLGTLVIPSTGCYWGSEDQATGQNFTGSNGIETVLGRRMAIRRQHYSWSSGPAAMPTSFETANDALTNPKVIHMVAQRGDGNFPVVNTGGGWSSTNRTSGGIRDITNGNYDARFTAQFNGLKGLNNPVLYNLWFECNGAHNNYYSLAQGTAGGSRFSPGTGETAYRDAYRHVRGLADSAGASISHGGNVIFVWAIQCDNSTGWFQNYYPGDAYVDILGVDLYRRTFSSGTNITNPIIGAGDGLFTPFGEGTQSGLPAVSRGAFVKPMLVAEAGYGNGIAYVNSGATGDGVNYFKDSSPYVEDLLHEDLNNRYINYVAYVHWNEAGITDNHVNQSPASLTAYRRFSNDATMGLTFGGSGGGGGGGGGNVPPTPTITASTEPANPTTTTTNTFSWTDSGTGIPQSVPFVGLSFERVEVPNVSSHLDVNNFSIAAWINPDFSVDTDPAHQRYEIMEKSGAFWFNIREDSTPKFLLRVGGWFGAGPTITDTFLGNTPITPGVWTHVVATYDGANLKTYINGSIDGTLAQTGATATGTTVTGVDEKLIVGAKHRMGTPGELLEALYNGKMTGFHLYGSALSATDINTLSQFGSISATPIIDYEFDSISGATVNDDGPGSNNGTGKKGNIGSIVDWNVSTTSGPTGIAPDHYRYRVSIDGTPGSWIITSSTNSGSLTFPAGHTYTFEIQAGNSSNQYSSSDSYTWVVNVSGGGPATPVITVAPTASSGDSTGSPYAAFLWTETNEGTNYRYFVKIDTPAGAGTYPGSGQVERAWNYPGNPIAINGTYTFHVKTWDGTAFSTEATWTWTFTGATVEPLPVKFTVVPTDPSQILTPSFDWIQP